MITLINKKIPPIIYSNYLYTLVLNFKHHIYAKTRINPSW